MERAATRTRRDMIVGASALFASAALSKSTSRGDEIGVRFVATTTPIPATVYRKLGYFSARSRHILAADVEDLQFLFSNWLKSGSTFALTSPGNPVSLAASVEGAGQVVPVTFDQHAQVVIADGGDILSDPIAFRGRAGDEIWVNTYRTAAGAFTSVGNQDSERGERVEYGAGTGRNKTMVGVLGGTDFVAMYRPTAILSKSNRRTFLLIGDSKSFGLFSGRPIYVGSSGISPSLIMPSLAPAHPVMNASMTGMRLAFLRKGYQTQMEALGRYATDVIIELGTNDFQAGATDGALQTDYETIRSWFPSKRVWLTTVDPRRDKGGLQFEPTRRANNEWKRHIPSRFAGCIDIARVYEGSQAGTFADTSDYNADQVHQTVIGYERLADLPLVRETLGLAL